MSDLEKSDAEKQFHDVPVVDKSNIEYERAQLLANLPDPDVGKSAEELAAIVSFGSWANWALGEAAGERDEACADCPHRTRN